MGGIGEAMKAQKNVVYPFHIQSVAIINHNNKYKKSNLTGSQTRRA